MSNNGLFGFPKGGLVGQSAGNSGYERISANLSVPLVFYWDDFRAIPANYVTNIAFGVVGTAPLRALVDSTTGYRFLLGSSGHYTVPTSAALEITGAVSYIAALRTGTIPSSNSLALEGILSKQTDIAGGISLSLLGNSFYAEFTNSGGTTFSLTSSVTVTSNSNYIVAAYRSGADCSISVNGTVTTVSTFTGTGIVQSTPLRIGSKTSNTFGFGGILKMAAVCNGLLTSGDLTYLNGLDFTKFPYG
jgi:hypothetical protein